MINWTELPAELQPYREWFVEAHSREPASLYELADYLDNERNHGQFANNHVVNRVYELAGETEGDRRREIEEMLGLPAGGLARSNLDMDLADDCSSLKARGVDLNDEAAVRKHVGERVEPHFPARYIDALVVVAKCYRESGARR
jgi:hypothetical protein